MMNQNDQMQHNEEKLEQLYWEFDKARKQSGEERWHFKGFMRGYAAHIVDANKMIEADHVLDTGKRVRLTEDEAKRAYRKGEQAAITRGIQSASHWLGLTEVMDAMIAKNGPRDRLTREQVQPIIERLGGIGDLGWTFSDMGLMALVSEIEDLVRGKP